MKSTIKEVVLISIGSPALLETWSGVPYFLLKELTRRQIKVNIIDLEPARIIKIIYNKIILPIISVFIKNGELSIYRSLFFRIYQKAIYKKELYKHKTADAIIGLSYNLMIPKISKRVILLSDWPFSYDLQKKGITPGIYQKFYICREKECMMNASQVISLFPTCANYINDFLGEKKAIALGVNVVNNLFSDPNKGVVSRKSDNKRIVFIGRKHYIQGARSLIASFKVLKKLIPTLQLDLVGLVESDFPKSFLEDVSDLKFWGYLDKGNKEQCKIYYEILNNASLYVNTTYGWVGYTSMIEAMYYYTPVVVYPCKEFIDEFGDEINFGVYCNNDDSLVDIIHTLLSDSDKYEQLCVSAHNRVAHYTWANFTDELLSIISEDRCND